jgi:hypothetical protein
MDSGLGTLSAATQLARCEHQLLPQGAKIEEGLLPRISFPAIRLSHCAEVESTGRKLRRNRQNSNKITPFCKFYVASQPLVVVIFAFRKTPVFAGLTEGAAGAGVFFWRAIQLGFIARRRRSNADDPYQP